MPSTGGGPGWALGTARLAVGELERAAELLYRVGGEELEHMVPVERCFDWEELVLLELRRGDLARAEAHAAAREADAARIGLRLPAALAKRGRAAVQLAQGDHAAAAASARAVGGGRRGDRRRAPGGVLARAAGPGPRGGRRARRGDRGAARRRARARRLRLDPRRATRRAASCGGSARGPRCAGRRRARTPASTSLTKREREIAELVTDRKTNRQIAATLFLSDKTIESHLRNVFVKLGASSRMEVALEIDRHRRGPPAAGA